MAKKWQHHKKWWKREAGSQNHSQSEHVLRHIGHAYSISKQSRPQKTSETLEAGQPRMPCLSSLRARKYNSPCIRGIQECNPILVLPPNAIINWSDKKIRQWGLMVCSHQKRWGGTLALCHLKYCSPFWMQNYESANMQPVFNFTRKHNKKRYLTKTVHHYMMYTINWLYLNAPLHQPFFLEDDARSKTKSPDKYL